MRSPENRRGARHCAALRPIWQTRRKFDESSESDMQDTKVLYEGAYLRLKRRGHWEYCERANSPGAVVILAVTANGKVLFVEQYRVPLGCRTIEMPAGLVGDTAAFEGESVETAAARELEEETGYRAGRIKVVMSGPSSAGMSNEMITLVHAQALVRVGSGGGDDSEDIRVHEVPLCDVDDWLLAQAAAGRPVDLKVYGGLYWIRRLRQSP